jgi:hypothetical protein
MLRFPDDTQTGVNGSDEIPADLYSQGKRANQETANEIINIRRPTKSNRLVPIILAGYREINLNCYRGQLERLPYLG